MRCDIAPKFVSDRNVFPYPKKHILARKIILFSDNLNESLENYDLQVCIRLHYKFLL